MDTDVMCRLMKNWLNSCVIVCNNYDII
jgi:hypothetical protein